MVAEDAPRLVPAAAALTEHQLRAILHLQHRPRTRADVVAEDVACGIEAPAHLALNVLNLRVARQRHGGEHVEQQAAQFVAAPHVAPELEDQHAVPGGNEGVGLVLPGISLAGRDFVELHLVLAHDGRAHLTGNVRRPRGDHLVQRLSGAALHMDAGHQAAVLQIPGEAIQLAHALVTKQRGLVLHLIAQGAAGRLGLRCGKPDAQQQHQQQYPFLHYNTTILSF